jgi:hypothetical protein
MNDRSAVLVLLLLLGCDSSTVPLKLPALIADHAVLQRDQPIQVWGWAHPGSRIRVTIGDRTLTVETMADSTWSAELQAMPAGGPHTLKVSNGKATSVVHDVLIGDVWLCSGQSNMEFPLRWSAGGLDAIARANRPTIRMFSRPAARTPASDVQGAWVACSPNTIADFSAVGYYFGATLQDSLDIPIGLIHNARGGASTEAWSRPETLINDPRLQGVRVSLTDPEWYYLKGQRPTPLEDSLTVSRLLDNRPDHLSGLLGVWPTGIASKAGTYVLATRISYERERLRVVHAHRDFGIVEGTDVQLSSDGTLEWTLRIRRLSESPLRGEIRFGNKLFEGVLRNDEIEYPLSGAK